MSSSYKSILFYVFFFCIGKTNIAYSQVVFTDTLPIIAQTPYGGNEYRFNFNGYVEDTIYHTSAWFSTVAEVKIASDWQTVELQNQHYGFENRYLMTGMESDTKNDRFGINYLSLLPIYLNNSDFFTNLMDEEMMIFYRITETFITKEGTKLFLSSEPIEIILPQMNTLEIEALKYLQSVLDEKETSTLSMLTSTSFVGNNVDNWINFDYIKTLATNFKDTALGKYAQMHLVAFEKYSYTKPNCPANIKAAYESHCLDEELLKIDAIRYWLTTIYCPEQE